jgi:hypothetical protein
LKKIFGLRAKTPNSNGYVLIKNDAPKLSHMPKHMILVQNQASYMRIMQENQNAKVMKNWGKVGKRSYLEFNMR